ncbi:MAG: hypothetical protein ACE145_21235 [Terriglobia bacterium]
MHRRSFLKRGWAAAGAAVSIVFASAKAKSAGAQDEISMLLDSQDLGAEASTTQSADILFSDDFSGFPTGWLSRPLRDAKASIQAYHYLSDRGVPLGPWANAICQLDSWIVGDEEGKSYLEQHMVNDPSAGVSPLFITGDAEWSDYTVEVNVKPLSFAHLAGVVFRYHTNRHYYSFGLTGGNKVRLAARRPIDRTSRRGEWRELGVHEFAYDTTRYYALKVENDGPRIRAYVDDRLLLEAKDEEIVRGKAGVTADIPARFQDFRVSAPQASRQRIGGRIRQRQAELAKLQKGNPQLKLWRKFSTSGFGAGRNARFGDLDGDGTIDMLIAQSIQRERDDRHDQISCLTAVTLDGRVLWQSGRPDPRNGLLTNDTPFQIHDVDGDGRNEVVLVRDFKLQILEGDTGKVRRWVWMPRAPFSKSTDYETALRPYERENGDCLAFFNLSGNKGRHEILVKDRYENFWIFDNQLELLWEGHGQTGHFPYPFDADDDGRDEIAIGYSLWDHTGRQLWSRDTDFRDHADSIVMGNLSGDTRSGPRIYAAGGDEGFLMFDRSGNILKQLRLGHAQLASVGKYRPDLPGLQYIIISFWDNPGIVTLLNADGDILAQEEPIHCGSRLLPVNWRGDGQEFALLSGNVREGGMIDGNLRRVVMFPDDGHPDLCAYVTDVTGDPRDEVILWDQERVWIYTQDRPFSGERIYAPLRHNLYNESNYRTEVPLPRWLKHRKGNDTAYTQGTDTSRQAVGTATGNAGGLLHGDS